MNPNDERGSLPSASQDAFWNCAGQHNLWVASGRPQIEEDEDAKRGTKIHAAFETGNTLELDEEETETYQKGLKFLDMLLAGWQSDRRLDTITEGPREERFWIRDENTMEPIASAKLDRHWITGSEACIIDFKSGFASNLPPSPKSTQLRVQLVALTDEHPNIRNARVAYCKPKLRAGMNDWCDYGPEDIAYARQWVRFHIWSSRQPDAPRTPGKHCGYCPAKAFCVEGASYSLLPSVIAERALVAIGGSPDKFDVEQAVNTLAPADLLKIWQSSTVIGKVIEAVKYRLKAMTDDQLEVLGLMRGKGRETRNVVKIPECIEYLRSRGWTEAEILACMEFSNEPLEQTARKQHGLQSDKAAKEWRKTNLEPFSEVKVSDPPLRAIP